MLKKEKQQMMKLAPKLLAETGVRNTLCDLLLPGRGQGTWLYNRDFIYCLAAHNSTSLHVSTKGTHRLFSGFCLKIIGNICYKIYI